MLLQGNTMETWITHNGLNLPIQYSLLLIFAFILLAIDDFGYDDDIKQVFAN